MTTAFLIIAAVLVVGWVLLLSLRGFASSKLRKITKDLVQVNATIDESARKIVGLVERQVDVIASHVPASPEAFPHLDFSENDAVWALLVAAGFGERGAFLPTAWLNKPPEEQSVSHYGLSADGTVVANFGTLKKHNVTILILSSRLSNGGSITTLNGIDSGVGSPPGNVAHRLPQDTPFEELIAHHRKAIDPVKGELVHFASVEDAVAWIDERSTATQQYRIGLGMAVFPGFFAVKFTGEREREGHEFLRRVMAHPEWYKYSSGSAQGSDRGPSAPEMGDRPAPRGDQVPLKFLASRSEDGERHTISTFGMMFSGLPELGMIDVAGNHSCAARMLITGSADALRRLRKQDATLGERLMAREELRFTLDESNMHGVRGRAIAAGHVNMRARLQPMGEEADSAELLVIDPFPDEPGDLDDRVYRACLALGDESAPIAKPQSWFETDMAEAKARARATLGDLRSRAGALGTGESPCVKVGLTTPGGAQEFVWVRVAEWRDDGIAGVVITPSRALKLKMEAPLSASYDDVADHCVMGPQGATRLPITDAVAVNYGHDI